MIDNKLILKSFLGKGGSSKVFLAADLSGNKFAVKIVRKDKKYPTGIAEKMLKTEHYLLSALKSHPNIIKSYGINLQGVATMDDNCENIMYNVLEYAENGPLSNIVRYTGSIDESISGLFILQIWSAIEYMHHKGYAHLDIKLENILLDEFFNIKLADMGGWLYVKDSNGFSSKRRGTTLYMPPEIHSVSSDFAYDAFKADVYSLGITLFVMLVGEFPHPSDFVKSWFTGESEETQDSTSESFSVSKKVRQRWKQLSKDMQEIILRMTDLNPWLRPTISEVYSYFWSNFDNSSEKIDEIYNEMSDRRKLMQELYNQEDASAK